MDFKEGSTPAVAECAAAMANLHGGLILIGVTDQDRKIVGVPREAMAYVADILATHLESPDWQPEMIEVPLDDGSGRYVLVLRVNPDAVPRPVFVQLTARFSKEKRSIFWAPVRMPGSTRPATLDELRALFAEQRPAQPAEAEWNLQAPQIPRAENGTVNSAADLALRSGLIVPAGAAAWGRPLSERAIAELAAALDRSALTGALAGLTGSAHAEVESFHPEGGANRSHTATLVRRLNPGKPAAFDMTVSIKVPGHYGHAHVQALELTLTLVSYLTAWLNVGRTRMLPTRRLETAEWAALLDAVATTLTSPAVIGPVADLASADPITVRQPRVLHVVSEPAMPDLLPAQLSSIRDGGVSHGAHMLADPALDLSAPAERAEQVDRWLIQMAADAGLLGMEHLVSKMRGDSARLSAVVCLGALPTRRVMACGPCRSVCDSPAQSTVPGDEPVPDAAIQRPARARRPLVAREAAARYEGAPSPGRRCALIPEGSAMQIGGDESTVNAWPALRRDSPEQKPARGRVGPHHPTGCRQFPGHRWSRSHRSASIAPSPPGGIPASAAVACSARATRPLAPPPAAVTKSAGPEETAGL